MGDKITIKIEVEIELDVFEDRSGLTGDELGQTVCDLVEDERNELAMEARIVAYKLLEGMTKDLVLMDRAEDELFGK